MELENLPFFTCSSVQFNYIPTILKSSKTVARNEVECGFKERTLKSKRTKFNRKVN